MAAGATYTPIQTYTIPSLTTTFSLTSIPSTYTDLIVVIGGGTAAPTGVYFSFNGDTSSNYSVTRMYGFGSGQGSGRTSNQTRAEIAGSWTATNTIIMNFQNYSNTTTYKTIVSRGSDATDTVSTGVALWRSTAAINSITFTTDSTNFAVGTVITIYGIAAA
jgi:hypothetical protein